jgi:hypothetical protein
MGRRRRNGGTSFTTCSLPGKGRRRIVYISFEPKGKCLKIVIFS